MSPSRSSRSELRTTLVDSGILPSLSRYGNGLKTGVTTIAFWTAIVLPFLHMPLLATGLENTSAWMAFITLIILNIIAVVLGQPHRIE